MFVVIRKINSQGWIWKVDPQGVQSAPPPTTDRPYEGGWNLRGPMESRTEASGTGREEKRVDLGGHARQDPVKDQSLIWRLAAQSWRA